MIRILATLFVVLSFAVSPAFTDYCGPFGDSASAFAEVHDNAEQHNSGKKDSASHHCANCCHQHVANQQEPAVEVLTLTGISVAIPTIADGLIPPFDPGPLLEPPSHV